MQPILDYVIGIWYQGKPLEESEVIHTGLIKGIRAKTKLHKNF